MEIDKDYENSGTEGSFSIQLGGMEGKNETEVRSFGITSHDTANPINRIAKLLDEKILDVSPEGLPYFLVKFNKSYKTDIGLYAYKAFSGESIEPYHKDIYYI